MVIINDKSPIKTNYGLLPYSQNSKSNKAVRVRNSVPLLYPDLFSNINNNVENKNINNENIIKNNKALIEDNNKYKIEINPKNKDGYIQLEMMKKEI